MTSADNPVPGISALAPTEATAGTGAMTLTVEGSDFIRSSVVQWNGSPRPTTFVSSTRLTATLGAQTLAAAGTYEVTVVNPAPGGGVSNIASFRIWPQAGVPTITDLPARGGTAGRSGFSLAVDGTNFVDGSVVRWNGADRPTTFRSPTRLVAAISTEDAAAAGTAQITVRNPGVSTVSNAVTFTLRVVPPAQTTQQRSIALAANDVIWDDTRGLLYASVPSTGGTHGNSVVAIDPGTGSVTKSVFVGSEPEHMAISDDDQFLYVSLRGSSSVRRITLSSFVAGIEFSLGSTVAEQMLVVPGAPRTVVMSRMYIGSSPKHAGVFVYDDGAVRPLNTPGHTGSNSIAFDGRTASVLYGYNNETTDFGFRSMRIESGGISEASVTGGLISTFYTRIFGGGGRIYGTDGSIIDPELRVRTGRFTGPESWSHFALFPEPQLGRVYFLASGAISAYDMSSMQPLGGITAPGAIGDHPATARLRLVRWGPDGFAYRDGTSVHILRSTLAAQ